MSANTPAVFPGGTVYHPCEFRCDVCGTPVTTWAVWGGEFCEECGNFYSDLRSCTSCLELENDLVGIHPTNENTYVNARAWWLLWGVNPGGME